MRPNQLIWAKESYDIASKIAYQNRTLRGTPKGKRRESREVTDAAVLPMGYVQIAKKIADRRMALSGIGWQISCVRQLIPHQSRPANPNQI